MRSIVTAIALLVAASILYAGEPQPRIVALGDSITKGVRAGVKVDQTYPSQLHKILVKEGIPTVILNVGIGGERTDQVLLRLDSIIKYYKTMKVAIIMFGTNDSYVEKSAKEPRISVEDYRKNLKKIVADVRKAGATPILMTPPRWGDKAGVNGIGEHPNVSLERYVKVCREVAEETKTPLVDHFAHWTKANAAGTDIGAWTTDQCHPNPHGHGEIARLLLPVVQRVLEAKAK